MTEEATKAKALLKGSPIDVSDDDKGYWRPKRKTARSKLLRELLKNSKIEEVDRWSSYYATRKWWQ